MTIRRVVYSVGGAKGAVYPGTSQALEDLGVLDGIGEFAGASSGSIVAAFMAVTMPIPRFRQAIQKTNLLDLLGDKVGRFFGSNRPGICFASKDGNPLEAFIRTHVTETVVAHLQSFQSLPADLKPLLNRLKQDNAIFTFRDLATLSQHYPNHFKSLTVLAAKFPTGEPQVFNAAQTPDVDIASACRASSSLPILLAPKEIEIDGQKLLFVDGGIFDNLPTDCFDIDEQGNFVKNRCPEQTLVYAFGDSPDDRENQIFQALYGARWDEVIDNTLLNQIIFDTLQASNIQIEKNDKLTKQKQYVHTVSELIKQTLNQLVQTKQLSTQEAEKLAELFCKRVETIILRQKEYKAFWRQYWEENNDIERLKMLSIKIRQMMQPTLYQPNRFEKLKRNYFMPKLGGLRTPFSNVEQKEKSYQKVRSDYALRTIDLRVGHVSSTDFTKATQNVREMDVIGYLDTVNHLTLHELHAPQFSPAYFYIHLVNDFMAIYTAVLMGAGLNPEKNKLCKKIAALKLELQKRGNDDAIVNRQLYQLIKEAAEMKLNGLPAFVLTRVVEYKNQKIDSEQLFKEVYERSFKLSGVFSVSKITGKWMFRASSLNRALQAKNMFRLFKDRSKKSCQTRAEKVFEALESIEQFQTAHGIHA